MFGAMAAVVIALPLIFFEITVAVGVICAICAVVLTVQAWLARRQEQSGAFRPWMILLPLVPAVAIIAFRGADGVRQLLNFFGTVA